MASFPDPVLPAVQGDPDYQTVHSTRKFLQANSREIETHLGGGTLEHLELIIYDAYYAMIAPTTDAGPILWITPHPPGGPLPTRMEQRPKSAQLATSWRRMIRLTNNIPPCNKH
jgi:hypothetical protein